MRAFLICMMATVLLDGSLLAIAEKDYEPLSEGCEWTMNSKTVLPTGETTSGIAHRKIEGQVERDGKIYVRVHTWEEGAPASYENISLARKDEAGYYSMAGGKKDAREQVELPRPLKVAQRWNRMIGQNTVINTVIGFETVTIVDKIYEQCCHIQAKWFNGSLTVDHWEAPNVGTVKAEMVSSGGVTITLTLKELKAGK